MFISEFKSLLYRPLIMLDQRKYSGHMKIKTCFPIFVIFFSLVPNLGNSDEKMLIEVLVTIPSNDCTKRLEELPSSEG